MTRSSFVLLLLLVSSAIARGQTTRTITTTVTCAACRIDLVPVVTLGASSDPGGVDVAASMARTRAGQYVVSSPVNRGALFAYDAAGKFVRAVGRAGQGPGELGPSSMLVVGPGDSVHAFTRGRHMVFTPSLEFAHDFAAPTVAPYSGYAVFPDGRFVVSTQTLVGDSILTITLVTPQGVAVRSFGGQAKSAPAAPSAPGQAQPPRAPFDAWVRALTVTPAGEIWAAHFDAYIVELWDTTGAHRATLVRDASWFHGGPAAAVPSERLVSPPSRILGVRVDQRGLLWVLVLATDPKWNGATHQGPITSASDVYDTIVEVLDPGRGVLVATSRVDQQLAWTPDGVVAYAVEEQADGDRRITVFEPRLTGYPGP